MFLQTVFYYLGSVYFAVEIFPGVVRYVEKQIDRQLDKMEKVTASQYEAKIYRILIQEKTFDVNKAMKVIHAVDTANHDLNRLKRIAERLSETKEPRIA